MSKLTSIKHNQGFTLVEILVALTLMSLMMISLYTIVENNINTKDVIVSEDRQFLQVYTAFHRAEMDLSQIYSPLYYSSLELPKENQRNQQNVPDYANNGNSNKNNVFVSTFLYPLETINQDLVPLIEQEDKNSLLFMTSSNKRYLESQKQSRYAWIYYSIESNPDAKGEGDANLMWVRRVVTDYLYDRNMDIKSIKPQVLLRGIKDFSLEFWKRSDAKWVDNFRLLNEQQRRTPRAFRIRITWVDDNNQEHENFKVIKPLWPYFDTVKDETERQSNQNSNGSNNQNNNDQGNTPNQR